MKIVGILEKIIEMHRFLKKYLFLFCVYKMVEIAKETWEENSVEVIVFSGKIWLNETNIKDQLKRSNLAAVTLKHPLKYRKQRQELQNCGNYQSCRKFLKKISNANNNGL